MAVFVAAADETEMQDARRMFFYGGFVASLSDWEQWFAPAWQERVLNGPPAIPYLHMTEIRSAAWRQKYGLSDTQAERRVDEALNVIQSLGGLYALSSHTEAKFFRDAFSANRVVSQIQSGTAPYRYEPDYICFLSLALTALLYVNAHYPDAERVDFVVERNGKITDHLRDFHATLVAGIEEFGEHRMAGLVGELIPGGKDRVPLQAADVLCWHRQRREAGTLTLTDGRRFNKLAGLRGMQHEVTREEIAAFAAAATKEGCATPEEARNRA